MKLNKYEVVFEETTTRTITVYSNDILEEMDEIVCDPDLWRNERSETSPDYTVISLDWICEEEL